MVVERRLAERAGGLAALLVEHVADHHPGASLDHQPRGLAANAARRPGDQRHLAVKPIHVALSCRRSNFATNGLYSSCFLTASFALPETRGGGISSVKV